MAQRSKYCCFTGAKSCDVWCGPAHAAQRRVRKSELTGNVRGRRFNPGFVRGALPIAWSRSCLPSVLALEPRCLLQRLAHPRPLVAPRTNMARKPDVRKSRSRTQTAAGANATRTAAPAGLGLGARSTEPSYRSETVGRGYPSKIEARNVATRSLGIAATTH